MSHSFRRLSSSLLRQSFAPKHNLACHRLGTPTSSKAFSTARIWQRDQYEEKARKLNQQGLDEHEQEVRVRQHQIKRPWHRDDADRPPAEETSEETEPVKGMLPAGHVHQPADNQQESY